MKLLIVFPTILLISLFTLPVAVMAHVTVSPDEVGIGARQNFSVNVPNEKDIPTVQVRLVIPAGLESVTPNVKSGWEIVVSKAGNGEEAKVTEIVWKNGQIESGLRDEFIFRAKAPTVESDLTWKAYQTYSDGTVVSWDMDPSIEGGHDGGNTPYSVTRVINDLSIVKVADVKEYLAVIALLLSAGALFVSLASLYYSRKQA